MFGLCLVLIDVNRPMNYHDLVPKLLLIFSNMSRQISGSEALKTNWLSCMSMTMAPLP